MGPIHVLDFAQARRQELVDLLQRQKRKSNLKGALELRKLRRRTTSHRRRVGILGLSRKPELKPGQVRALTRPRRRRAELKHPGRNVDEGKYRRLETHVWHAKRMRMETQWGFALPISATRKPSKAVVRAARTGCTLHDASYHQVLELTGEYDTLTIFLAFFMDPADQAALTDAGVREGERMGHAFLYEANAFPRGCIGPLRFLWSPPGLQTSEGSTRKLWLWLHPSIFSIVHDAIKSLQGHPDLACAEALLITPVPDVLTFEIRGPKAHVIAQRVILPYPEIPSPSLERTVSQPTSRTGEAAAECMASDDTDTPSTTIAACPLTYAARQNAMLWAGLLKHLVCPSHLPAGVVLALTAIDPRERPPQHEPWNVTSEEAIKYRAAIRKLTTKGWPAHAAVSPLWFAEVRKSAGTCMLQRTEHSINCMRHESRRARTWRGVLDGGRQRREKERRPLGVPLLLIARSALQGGGKGGRLLDSCGGYDVIIPGGWGCSVWHALVAAGAKAIGTRDCEQLALQAGRTSFPRDFPDTAAGNAYWGRILDEEGARQAKRPPAKRVFVPAMLPWASSAGASEVVSPLLVIRRQEYLKGAVVVPGVAYNARLLPEDKEGRRSSGTRPRCDRALGKNSTQMRWQPKGQAAALPSLPPLPLKTYVTVSLRCVAGGSPAALAEVLLPSAQDFLAWEAGGFKSVPQDGAACESNSTGTLSSRTVCGWITAGGFSIPEGQGFAIAVVEVESLRELQMRAQRRKPHVSNVVLFRSPRSGVAWPASVVIDDGALQ